jgi:hypothetical protein
MNDELEGRDGGLIDVLSWHFPSGTEEKHENLRHDNLVSELRFELSIS